MHDNDGPVICGGPSSGGDQLRQRIRALLAGYASASGIAADALGAKPEALGFKGFTTIQAWGEALTMQIDQYGRSWVLGVAPTFRDDAVQLRMAIAPGAGCMNSPKNSAFPWSISPWCWGSAGAGDGRRPCS